MSVMETLETTMAEEAGAPSTENAPASNEPGSQTGAQPDQAMSQEDLKAWAIGIAAQEGYVPVSLAQQQQQPRQEPTVHVEMVEGFPKPASWDEMAPGEQEAYLSAMRANKSQIDAIQNQFRSELDNIKGTMARASVLQSAKSQLPEQALPYFDKAVAEIERANGAPINTDHPLMAEVLVNKAKAMLFDSGTLTRPGVPGETVKPQGPSAAAIPQYLKDTYKPMFFAYADKDGNVSDEVLAGLLKQMGIVW